MKALLATIALLVGSLPAAAASLTITPASPRSLDTVRVQVPSMGTFTYALDKTRVTMSGTHIQVVMAFGGAVSPVPPPYTTDVLLGDLPEGTYHVDLLLKDTDPFLPVASMDFTVAARATDRPDRDLTDLWWDETQSGWGLNVVQHASGKLFAVWFVYGTDGRPVWYVMPDGAWARDRPTFSGDVYRTSGPVGLADFDPASVQRKKVGEAAFTSYVFYGFSDDRREALYVSWTVDGQSFQKTLRRQPW